MPFSVIIPARYAASRLPGKVLADIAGRPLIQHVYERARQSSADQIIIATDDTRVFEVARSFGATVCMTDALHPTGTDRVAQAATLLDLSSDAIVVNVQGDEPLINPQHIDQVALNLTANPWASLSTLCEPMVDQAEILNPNRVKVVFDAAERVLLYSRSPIPWDQTGGVAMSANCAPYYRALGIYAYRVDFLKRYVRWQQSTYERLENIETLRVLWQGEQIHIAVVTEPTLPGVDCAEDLALVRQAFAALATS
jgi:3-deoxy-manno-octulosonate cytidylyltransferase (CMP-KDO synthetase)